MQIILLIKQNSWFLYGSKKPGSQTYKLTKIFNNELNIVYDHIKEEFYNNYGEIINNGYYYDDETIINYLSIRNKKNITKLNNQYTESDIEELINNQCKELDKNFKNQKDKHIIELDNQCIELDNQCIELDNQCIELYNQCMKLNEKCIKIDKDKYITKLDAEYKELKNKYKELKNKYKELDIEYKELKK